MRHKTFRIKAREQEQSRVSHNIGDTSQEYIEKFNPELIVKNGKMCSNPNYKRGKLSETREIESTERILAQPSKLSKRTLASLDDTDDSVMWTGQGKQAEVPPEYYEIPYKKGMKYAEIPMYWKFPQIEQIAEPIATPMEELIGTVEPVEPDYET